MIAGTYSHPEREDIEVRWPVTAVREFDLLSDDVWEGVGVVNGTDYLVTEHSLSRAGYALTKAHIPATD